MYIKTNTSQATIYLNGEEIGQGNKIISNIKPGKYKVKAVYEKQSISKTIWIKPDLVNIIKMNVKRNFNFHVTHIYSFLWHGVYHSKGPGIDMGYTYKNHRISVDFILGFFGPALPFQNSITEDMPDDLANERIILSDHIGGTLLRYEYTIPVINRILLISPGIGSILINSSSLDYRGYYKNATTFIISKKYNNEDFDFLLGSVSCSLLFGYRFVFLYTNYSFLFGTTVGHNLRLGIEFSF